MSTTAYSIEDLERWIAHAEEETIALGTDFFPQIFEVCNAEQMIGYMAYIGMPSHYSHWSFGKQYEMLKTQHRYDVVGLPYEMVINSDPCLAYLMNANTLALQILTINHVYFHNNFFKHNPIFKETRPELVLARMKTATKMVQGFIDDPLIGIDKVEEVLDAAHALQFHGIKNCAIKRRSREEQIAYIKEQFRPEKDPHAAIHPAQEEASVDELKKALGKVPLEPEEDVLLFIRDNSRRLEEWEKALITLVHDNASYFFPQAQTKSMNEGHACTGHKLIMDSLNEKGLLPEGVYEEFLVSHNKIIRPHPKGGINPYHIGFKTFEAIRLWYDGSRDPSILIPRDRKFYEEMKRDFEERDAVPPDTGLVSGLEKQYAIRDVDRDTSFFRQYLTLPIMRRMHLFVHEELKEEDGSRIITDVVNENNWQRARDILIAGTGENMFPTVKVEDMNFKGSNVLYLKHYPEDGRELQGRYAEETLKHVARLSKYPATLECRIDTKLYYLTCDSKGKKVQTKILE